MKAHKAQSVDVSCLHFFLCLILRCKPEDAQSKFASALLHLLIQFERLTISLFLTEGTVPVVRFYETGVNLHALSVGTLGASIR